MPIYWLVSIVLLIRLVVWFCMHKRLTTLEVIAMSIPSLALAVVYIMFTFDPNSIYDVEYRILQWIVFIIWDTIFMIITRRRHI